MAYIGKTREPAFQFYADQTTIDLAKKLRRKMTPYEKALWQRLRTHKIAGFKFRRQHPIKFYIADFYCHEARLVVEVDGPMVKGLPPLQGEGRGGVSHLLVYDFFRFPFFSSANNPAVYRSYSSYRYSMRLVYFSLENWMARVLISFQERGIQRDLSDIS